MDWKLTLAALLTMAAAVVGATPLKVGLYADKGCRGAGACWWARILDGSPDAELKLLSGEDLRTGGLSRLDLLVNPGGAGGPQTEAMGEAGMAAVRKFVADGASPVLTSGCPRPFRRRAASASGSLPAT